MAHSSFPTTKGRGRPWSPPANSDYGGSGRPIDYYMAHSSHGWAENGFPGGRWDDDGAGHEETLRRHRQNLRAAYEPEYDAYSGYRSQAPRQRREASDISVEALDLADYALNLRRAEVARNDVYPSYNNDREAFMPVAPQAPWMAPSSSSAPRHSPIPGHRAMSPPSLPYPPLASLPMERPFSALSQDTMMPPPSLVSNGTTSHSSHTNASLIPQPRRRPFSLPADYSAQRGPAIFNARSPTPSSRGVGTGRRVQIDNQVDYDSAAVNIGSFPPWARKWYDQEVDVGRGTSPASKGKQPQSPINDEIFGPYMHPSGSQRDVGLLPWSSGPANDDQVQAGAVPDYVKEERMRMLEKEFGDKRSSKGWKRAEDGEEKTVGSVDAKGHLITAGPKKRATVRWFQAIVALATAGSGIYGAVFIKLNEPAPPSGRAAAYILYVLSILTPLLLFFFFVITPLCLRRNKEDSNNPANNPAGMMVLPVSQQSGKGTKKKGKKGKGPDGQGGSVQVNLIVDPGMFGADTGRSRGMPGRYDDRDYDSDSDDNVTNPSSRRKGRRRRDRDGWGGDDEEGQRPPQRRSIFAGLAMERAWRRARSDFKKRLTLDIFMTILWTGCFILILLGNRCPAGTLNGWCDAYNIATAGASVLVALFATSVFFGIKDLHQSKQSPRTRT